MLSAIAKPFGMLLMWLYDWLGNYGLAIILFALLVKVIMLPFQLKTKKSSLRQQRLQPRLADIQKRYAGNQQKINEETQKLYQEENIKPMAGCLWSLLPFPILIALYEAIRFPLTTMMGVAKEALEEGGTLLAKLTEMGFSLEGVRNGASYGQIFQAQFISEHWDAFDGLVENLRQIDFSFFGVNLGNVPDWKFLFSANYSSWDAFWPGFGLFLIPVIAAFLTWLSSKVAMGRRKDQPQDPSMASMNIMMPMMTLVFAFMMPSSMGLYWAAGSLCSIVQDAILNSYYNKVLDKEDAINIERRKAREAELEAKRKETERLRAEGITNVNPNTSKRKQQQKENKVREAKAAQYERKKAIERGEEVDPEPGRIGDRKYARGRAYDPDRYKKPSADVNNEPAEDGHGEE